MSLVSILIPTYNQPEFFRQALESALSQDYPEIEIVVSDDSTDDRVEKVVESYHNPKFPIRYYKHTAQQKHVGYENMLYLINLARGDFVNYLLHDDLFMPQKISKMISMLTDNVAFVTSRRYVVDEVGNLVKIFGLENMSSLGLFFPCEELGYRLLTNATNPVGEMTSVLMRRKDLFNAEHNMYEVGFFLDRAYPFHTDLPTWLQLSRMTDKIAIFIKEPLSVFRKHSDQVSKNVSALLNIFVEFPEMVARAFITNTFLHDEEALRKSCKTWLKNLNVSLQAINHDSVYNLKTFAEMDLLIQIIESVENEDFDRFLKLATSRPKI